jgi:acyl carrier protein
MKLTINQLRQIIKEELTAITTQQFDIQLEDFNPEQLGWDSIDKARTEYKAEIPFTITTDNLTVKSKFIAYLNVQVGSFSKRRYNDDHRTNIEVVDGASELDYNPEIIEGTPEDFENLYDNSQFTNELDKLAENIKEQLEDSDLVEEISDEVIADAADAHEESSDPYGYRGLRRSDFY